MRLLLLILKKNLPDEAFMPKLSALVESVVGRSQNSMVNWLVLSALKRGMAICAPSASCRLVLGAVAGSWLSKKAASESGLRHSCPLMR